MSGSPQPLEREVEIWPLEVDRYEQRGVLGRGANGVTYLAHDRMMGREVAIKVLAPIPEAQRQRTRRGLEDDLDVVRKEASVWDASGTMVPRYPHEDENGTPYLVMPVYKQSLADIVEEAHADSIGTSRTAMREQRGTESGLWMNDVLRYVEQMCEAVTEYHQRGSAHSDLQPANWLVQETRYVGGERLLLNDFGTETALARSEWKPHRDNVGWVYVRAPSNFKKNSHPSGETDWFAVGALFYKMLTGNYPFEEEIDGVIKETGTIDFEKIHAAMFGENGFSTYEKREKLLEHPAVPDEFKSFLNNALSENYGEGGAPLNTFRSAVRRYTDNRAKAEAVANVRKERRMASRTGFFAGVGLCAAIAGFSWLNYLQPMMPDHELREDLGAMISVVPVDKSTIRFEMDGPLVCDPSVIPVQVPQKSKGPFSSSYSLNEQLTDISVEAAHATGGYHIAYNMAYMHNMLTGAGHGSNDARTLEDLWKHTLAANMLDDRTVDIEDALVTTFIGPYALRRAQKFGGPTYREYVNAVDPVTNERLIPHPYPSIFNNILCTIGQEMPGKVRLR